MRHWDSSLIQRIFAAKDAEKSEDRDNLLSLTSKKLYGEKIHYVLELIQNAEDEGSERIGFAFDENSITVANDGRPFDEEDVWGICSVRPGRKKNKIGFFGIGFKSVFSITKTPQIISSKYNFQLDNYIYPTPKNHIPRDAENYYFPDKGAVFVLPYCEGMPKPQQLIADFNVLDSRILLFLDNLRKLEFHDNISNIHWEIEKRPAKDSEVILIDGRQEEETKETKWRVFHQVIPVRDKGIVPEGKEGITETRLTIALPVDSATSDATQKKGVVYCYLPTKRRTDLRFLIQADFLPTIGRENVSDHPWNIWLMQELGEMAADVIDVIKDDAQLGNLIYELIPLKNEIQDELITQLYDRQSKSLKEKKIAKTTHGWIKPAKCAIPDKDGLRAILGEPDLRALLGENMHYIDNNLSVEGNEYTRAENVLFELGARRIGTEEVIAFLRLNTLPERKPLDWFLDLYDFLSNVSEDENSEGLFEELKKTSFILTDERKLVPLVDQTKPDRLICYPQNVDMSELHQLFTQGEVIFLHPYLQESTIVHRKVKDVKTEEKRSRAKEWLGGIGVRKHFKQAHIIKDVILPKFITGKYQEYDDRKQYDLLNYVRNYWSAIESEVNSKNFSASILREIRSGLKLKSFRYENGNKINEYASPGEIYFSKRYGKSEVMEDLFHEIEGTRFLASYYLNRDKTEVKRKKRGRQRPEYTWRRFLEILGVWSSPRVTKIMERTFVHLAEYEWLERQYSTRGHQLYGDSYSDDIKRVIDYCSKLDNRSENLRRLTILWDSLAKSWKLYRDRGFFTTRHYWFYNSEKYLDYDTSSFLEYLRNATWVPDGEDNGFYKPCEVFADTKLNRLLLGNGITYVTLRASESFLKDLRVNIEPESEQVVEQLVAYRERNPKPKGNQVNKTGTIYRFLRDKLNEAKDTSESDVKQLREIFSDRTLLYLPREDNAWWKPSRVLWRDCSDRFGSLRGYIEHKGITIYDNGLKDFFSILGILEEPSIEQCLDVLDDLKSMGSTDYYRRVASKVYPYIESLLIQSQLTPVNWNRSIFLSQNGVFLPPPHLHFSDNDEYRDYFKAKVNVLWLPCSWANLKNMLKAAGFNCISKNVLVVKRFGPLAEIEGDSTNQIVDRLQNALNYLRKKNIELYHELQGMGVQQVIKKLQIYETNRISLDFCLTCTDTEPAVIKDVFRQAYLSHEENRLYKLDRVSLFSTPVAKELSRLFVSAEDDIFPFLDSIFGVSGEDELREKLKYFGILSTDTATDEHLEEVKLALTEEEMQHDKEAEPKGGEKPVEELPHKPQPPEPKLDIGKPDLVDPDEFIFDVIEEHVPYVGTDGSTIIPARIIKPKIGQPGNRGMRQQPRKKAYRGDAEEIALELAMRFEEIEDRFPDDRHEQMGIGYDIFSSTSTGEERFIEVKHFRGELGTWELTPYEWRKAEEEQERYFVYVVSGLTQGNSPSIQIVQNPVKYLMPDPPVQKKFSNWRNGIRRVVKFQNI